MTHIKRTWSRRDFLRAAGLGTAAVSLGNYLPAMAADGDPVPKRVVFFISPLGSRILGGWRPMLGHTDPITADKLGPILSPLGDYTDKMLLVEGLDIGPTYWGTSDVMVTGHNARSCVWTGANLYAVDACSGQGNIGFATGHSIDREIQVAWGLSPSKLHTITVGELGCLESRSVAYYEASGSPMAGENSPQNYFDTHWGDGLAVAGNADLATARRLKMYEQIKARLGAMRAQMPARDHVRFDRHIAAVDTLHAELGAEPQIACLAPDPPTITHALPKMQLGKVKNKDLVSEWFRLIAAAIRCDAGRIFGVQYGYDGHTGVAEGIIPSGTPGDLHTLSHEAGNGPAAAQVMVEFNAYFSQELKTFMDALATIPEADGTTALDNTLIVWGTSMSEGASHSNRNAPFVLLGGGNTNLKMGHYFNFGGWPNNGKAKDHGGLPHNHLLVTILHALGIEADHFGSELDFEVGDLDEDLLVS